MSPEWIYENVYTYRESLATTERPWIYPMISVQILESETTKSIEEQKSEILEHIQKGHDYYYREKYLAALDEYKRAQELILQLIYYDFRYPVIMGPSPVYYRIELLPTMLEVATEHARLGFRVGPISPWIKPKYSLVKPNILKEFKKELCSGSPGPKPAAVESAKLAAEAYARIGEPDRGEKILKEAQDTPIVVSDPRDIGEISLIRARMARQMGDIRRSSDLLNSAKTAFITAGYHQGIERVIEFESTIEGGDLQTSDPIVKEANILEVVVDGEKKEITLGEAQTVPNITSAL